MEELIATHGKSEATEADADAAPEKEPTCVINGVAIYEDTHFVPKTDQTWILQDALRASQSSLYKDPLLLRD